MKKLIFGFLSVSSFGIMHAQQHVCGTDIYAEKTYAKSADFIKIEAEHNAASKSFVKQQTNQDALTKRAAKYTIPVVFHVIHTGGSENISREQILDQIRILNEDFSYTNANKSNLRSAFTNVAGVGDIEFKLASIDPNGNCFDGINRIYSPAGVDMDMEDEPVKDLAYWNYRKYLNIWVVTNIVSPGSTGTVLGYAVFPWTSSFSKDGIVLRHDRVGSIGTAAGSDDGRTLTHEVGHWLGLYHTFQGGCNDGDQCDDTPPVASTFTNANCPANGNSCSNDRPDLPDMWENYMDYSNGTCMSVFTKEQVARMHYYLETLRSSIYASSNLLSTGVTKQNAKPTALFNSNTRVICAGKPVTFYDLSCKGEVNGRLWTFSGATKTTYTEANPVVTYSKPGVYEVKLQVENNFGSDSRTETNYITVVDAVGDTDPNYEEGFENQDPASSGTFVHLSPTYKFDRTNAAGYTGSYCYRANINAATPKGSVFSFQTPSFNIAKLGDGFSPKFTFWVSYAQPNADISETLKVYISTDCGGSWDQIYLRNGSSLAYLGANYSTSFRPTSSNQWRRHGLGSLSSLGYGDAESAIFRIDVISGGGNPVYIDNINMSPYFAETQEVNLRNISMSVNPNPANKESKIVVFNPFVQTTGQLMLCDARGRVLSKIYEGTLNSGEQSFELGFKDQISPGIYFVTLTTNQGNITQSIIFQN